MLKRFLMWAYGLKYTIRNNENTGEPIPLLSLHDRRHIKIALIFIFVLGIPYLAITIAILMNQDNYDKMAGYPLIFIGTTFLPMYFIQFRIYQAMIFDEVLAANNGNRDSAINSYMSKEEELTWGMPLFMKWPPFVFQLGVWILLRVAFVAWFRKVTGHYAFRRGMAYILPGDIE